MLHPFSRSTDVSNGLSSRLLSVRLPCVRPFDWIMPFVHSPKGKALVLAVHSRETRNFSRETRLVSRETRHVSRETRRVSRDGGNLHLSGTVTAQSNGELLDFLKWFQQSRSKKSTNLSSVVKTDMPKYPGRKGGVPSTARRSHQKLPIAERVKRTYDTQVPNANPFYLKEMTTRIKVCQGCRRSLKSTKGELQPPPYDYCIVRKERRPYTDRVTGQLRTPSWESDAHYHLQEKSVKVRSGAFIYTQKIFL